MNRKGFALPLVFVAIALVAIIGVILYNQTIRKPVSQSEKTPTPLPTVSISEGVLQIKKNEPLIFPSGAILHLENNQLYFSYKVDIPAEERLVFNKKIAFYVNGYSHILDNVNCEEETRFFDDYWAPVVTQCSMQSSIVRDEKPSLLSYDGATVDFASVANKNVSRFRTIQEEPWIAVSVPYFQIARRSDAPVVNVVSPREDVVNIYTNFGRIDFQFEADELENQQAKTIKKGPLTVNLVPQELTCAPPYRESDGSCYVLESKGIKTTTYNIVNFHLTIDEQDYPVDYPILIDIEN